MPKFKQLLWASVVLSFGFAIGGFLMSVGYHLVAMILSLFMHGGIGT